jgi:putative endonuclease
MSSNTHQREDLSKEKASSTWYLYLIENRLGQLYTGITTDPKRRIAQHRGEKAGGAKALKGKSPLTFRAIFQIASKSEAAVLECKVKKLTRTQKNTIIQSEKLELTNKGGTLTLNCIKAEFVDSLPT